MKKRRKNIALFGLSANPVTDRGGHGEIVKALLAMERIKTNGDDDDETTNCTTKCGSCRCTDTRLNPKMTRC